MINPLGTLNALAPTRSCMHPANNPQHRLQAPSNALQSQSIIKTLESFFGAVQVMKDVVMVPNRLKDIKFSADEPSPTVDKPMHRSMSMPSTAKCSSTQLALQTPAMRVPRDDLLLCYEMVAAVSNDLMSGQAPQTPIQKSASDLSLATTASSSVSDDHSVDVVECSDDEQQSSTSATCADESSRFMSKIREQVHTFSGFLHYMTHMANHLTSTYQQQVDNNDDPSMSL